MRTIGSAQRVRVSMPLGAQREAWDCRAFGLGRVVAPQIPATVELAPGTYLDLRTGVLRAG